MVAPQGAEEGGSAPRGDRTGIQHCGWRGRRGHLYFLHLSWGAS